MQNIIYYFTGTGNSLYAAKRIAAALPDCALISMSAQHIPLPDETTGRIGFVYPVYAGGLPRMVRRFIGHFDFSRASQAYIFGAATHGGHLLGGVRDLGEAIAQRGAVLAYGGDVKLPGNFLLLYGRMDTADAILAASEPALDGIIADILAKAEKPVMRPSATIRKVHDAFMADLVRTGRDFAVTGGCIGCGLCASLCPAGNIAMQSGRPVFSDSCEGCMACVQCCPNRAIDHKNGLADRERYRHPRITIQELIDRNR